MRTDAEIQKDVMAQLQWEAFLNPSEIGVAVKGGVVTLSGHVDSYSKKIGAEYSVIGSLIYRILSKCRIQE